MSIEPLRAAIDDALQTWAEPARAHLPMAIWCAAEHPRDPGGLCKRLDGHKGLHQVADGLDAWSSNPTDTEETEDA